MKAPVSVCMIVKNEIGQIESCLKSIRPYVEEIVVVDTGSSDGTYDIIKKYADIYEIFTDCNDSEGRIASFSVARQRSFDLATKPWVFWIDGDDEVQGAEKLNEIVSRLDKDRGNSPAFIMFPYEYSHDEHGNVSCYHYRERIITPKNSFHWIGPVHEVLNPDVPGTMCVQSDLIKIVHRRTQSKKTVEPNRNLRILKAHYGKVGESDVRQLYYLGLEYGNIGDIGNSIKFHKRYVELSGWDDEKFLACMKIAEHYQSGGNYDDSIQWALKALTVREGWSEAYFSLAKSYYFMAQRGGPDSKRNWQKCVHFSRLGLQLPPTKTILFVNPLERDYEIHKYLNFALNETGDVDGALESVEKALSVRPSDEGLLLNKKVYKNFLLKNRIRKDAEELVNLGVFSKEQNESINVTINSDGKVIKNELKEIKLVETKLKESPINKTEDSNHIQISGKKLDIVFYVGPGPENWDPKTVEERGIGGSETAVYEMAKHLTKRGHKIRVYGDCPSSEGIYDGVNYINHTSFSNVSCDVLITSRRPHVVDNSWEIKAKAVICWVHDTGLGTSLNHQRALRIDKFLTLSQWHKDFFMSQYKFIHPSQVLVTRNGINLDKFNVNVERNPHRAVYSSSPDRGMEIAVRCWPRIREKIPNAELHVYYGFQTWEVSARSINDKNQLDLIQRLKDMLEDHKKHGVFFHGRVNQKELAIEFLKSGVWAYPTWFTESSCITAMEAQAAGLRIVTSPIAALNETVGSRGSMVPGDWLSPSYQNLFVDEVIKAMLKTENSDRTELQEYAKQNFCYEKLVDDWDVLINNILNEVEVNVLPQYQSA